MTETLNQIKELITTLNLESETVVELWREVEPLAWAFFWKSLAFDLILGGAILFVMILVLREVLRW